jgi:putative nucleotidyltransferase with HDIG domain
VKRGDQADLNHYLPHMAVATFVVAVLPVIAVSTLASHGLLPSIWISALAGAALSMGLGGVGNAVWKRYRNTRDLVFSDLLLWGWLRRKWIERRLAEATDLLADFRTDLASADTDERLETLKTLAGALEAGDPYTHGHSRRVTRHAYMIGKTMGLSDSDLDKLRTAAALHDIGKLYTPQEILHKPDRLTDEEYEVIKEHPGRGAEMAAPLDDPDVIAMIRHHHERLDGKGYPDGLIGDEIPLGARIIAVSDTFDAITSTRPYRRFRTHKSAIAILKKEAGSQLDREAVEAFLKYYAGRRSIAWWASVAEAPQRVLGWAYESMQTAALTAAKAGVAVAATSVMLNPVVSRAADVNVADDLSATEMTTVVTMGWQAPVRFMETVSPYEILVEVSVPPAAEPVVLPPEAAVVLTPAPSPGPSETVQEQTQTTESHSRRARKSHRPKSESKPGKQKGEDESKKEDKASKKEANSDSSTKVAKSEKD